MRYSHTDDSGSFEIETGHLNNIAMQKYRSILQYISYASHQFHDNPAFIIRRRVKREIIRYKEIPEILGKLEAFFRKEKISQNTKILTWGTNCPEYALVLLGCFALKRTAVPIDYRNSQTTIKAIIRKTKPDVAFVSRFLRSDFLLKSGIRVYFFEELLENLKTVTHVSKYSKLVGNDTFVNSNNLSEIVFTSGTTGMPKGVVIRQKHILSNLMHTQPSLPDLSNARIVSILPLSHMFEQLVGLLLVIGQGASLYYPLRLTSVRLLEAFQQHKPTHQIFVPQLLSIIWDKIEDRAARTIGRGKFQKLLRAAQFFPMPLRKMFFGKIHAMFGGSLKMIAVGGAPMDVAVARCFEAVGFPVLEGYGATEVTAIATFNRPGRVRLGTVGKPIDNVEISTDEYGEIYIKSDAVAQGYYNDTDRTKHAFTKNGYKTGDIGFISHDGYLTIRGRDDFKIVLPSGEKVFVEDLERVIKTDSRVREVCAVAKRVKGGDAIHAFFILKDGVDVPLRAIVAEINQKLESKQQITTFEIYKDTDFPRTPTLKIDRKSMFDLANSQSGQKSAVKSLKDTMHDIYDVLAKVAGVPKVSLKDSDFLTTDLSLDSLSRVELVSLAEEYLGVILDETKINQKTTVADLRKMVAKAQNVSDVFIPSWQFTAVFEKVRFILLKLILFPVHSYIVKLHLPQRKVPYIPAGSLVIFNHPGPGDGICALRVMDKQGNLKFMVDATASLWKKRTLKIKIFLELLAGGIPLYESGQPMLQVFQLNSDLMDRGYNLLFAPQGTMQRTDRENPFKPGVGYLVKELDCPVSIVKIKGYREFWPAPSEDIAQANLKNLLPKKRGTATVKVSPSIRRDWSDMTPVQISNLLEEKYHEL